MKKRGFTLIELLAVIVVLAIIALISVPIIIHVIEKAKKDSFVDTAYGIINAAKLYYADAYLDKNEKEENFTFPSDTKLKIAGTRPKGGNVVLYEDGKVNLSITDGLWCALKNKEEEKITIKEYSVDTCHINLDPPKVPETCFVVNESGNTITDYICENTDIIIPSKISDVTITSIGESAFQGKNLTSVLLPESILSIEKSAFDNNLLTEVKVPSGVTSIGAAAFRDNQLSSIELPDSVKSIGASAFYGNRLTSVHIPNNIKGLESAVFSHNQLTSIEIPSSVTYIEQEAFGNNQLTSVTFSNGLLHIRQYAFMNNQLASVEIPSSVSSIASSAFRGNLSTMKVMVNKKPNSISDSPWGASSVEWLIPLTYQNGTAIYYNPNTNTKCTAAEAVSTTLTKTGCMKWYTFLDREGKTEVNMILDHNISGNVAWNSSRNSAEGMKEVETQLREDTSNWKVTARLITAAEVASLVGAEEALEWSLDKSYAEVPVIGSSISWFYFDGAMGTDAKWQTQIANASSKSSYAWLYDNLEDCLQYGCNREDNKKYPVLGGDSSTAGVMGYWTSTALPSWNFAAFTVGRKARLHYCDVDIPSANGIRPVITVSKTIIT